MDEIKTPNITPPENLPTTDSPEPEELPAKPRISSKPRASKPLVEGINSPVVTAPGLKINIETETKNSGLTEAEKKLINSPIVKQNVNEPKPMSQFMPVKRKSKFTLYAILFTGLILVGVAYGAVLWYKNRTVVLEENKVIVVTHKENVKSDPTPTPNVVPASSTPAVASTSPVFTPTSTTSTEVQIKLQLKIKETPTGYLNVRETPTTSGKLVVKVNPGEVYEYKVVKNSWYEIVLPDGKTGWVTGQYVEKLK